MKTDTSPEAEAVQIELLRRASVSERIAKAMSLTRMTFHLAKRAIARANPGLGQRELDLIFIEIHYGKDLADRVREYCQERE